MCSIHKVLFACIIIANTVYICVYICVYNWASEANPTLGCSIEISRDIYIYICMCVCRMSN